MKIPRRVDGLMALMGEHVRDGKKVVHLGERVTSTRSGLPGKARILEAPTSPPPPATTMPRKETS